MVRRKGGEKKVKIFKFKGRKLLCVKAMAGKMLLQVFYFSCIFLSGNIHMVRTTPVYSLPIYSEPGKFSNANNRVVVAEVDKPIDAILEAVIELGGNIMMLIPQRDFEKRDPSSAPDLGTGRSYSGQKTANVMWGQLASNSPTGPGRRKRNSTDGRGATVYSLDRGELRSILKKSEENFPE